MTALSVSNLRKSFGTETVLDGVDLTVEDGHLTAVLGASGCGKTTLLRLVAGFEHPDSGTIAFGEATVCGPGVFVSPQRRRVGYVPQEGALFPHLDVSENIIFGLPRTARKQQHRVEELLELVGLDPRVRRRPPHELSGGQQQRVALARALAPRPTLLLLDEPFSSLDASLRAETREAVAIALRASGASALLVTHDQGEAMSMADRIAIMRDGRIIQAGSPAAVYEQPVDAETARCLGDAVVLEAQVLGGIAQTSLGSIPLKSATSDGPVRLVVRPEQIRILPVLTPGQVGAARVDRIEYYGHDSMVWLTVLSTDERISARILGDAGPPIGAEVQLQLVGEGLHYGAQPGEPALTAVRT